MGIEISKRVRDLVEKDGRDFILGFPEKGEKFVSSLTGDIVEQKFGHAQEHFGEIRLVLKKKPKWPTSLSFLPIAAFDLGNKAVYLRDSNNCSCGEISLEILNAEEFKEFEKGVIYYRRDCS